MVCFTTATDIYSDVFNYRIYFSSIIKVQQFLCSYKVIQEQVSK